MWHTLIATLMWHILVAHSHSTYKPHSIVFVAEAICRLFSCSNYLEIFLYFSFSSAACNTERERDAADAAQ